MAMHERSLTPMAMHEPSLPPMAMLSVKTATRVRDGTYGYEDSAARGPLPAHGHG